MNVMTKRGQKDNIITYEHICDYTSDMMNIPPQQITLGSTCIVLNGQNSGLEIYMANSQKEWQSLIILNNESDSGGGSIPDIFDITNPQNGDILVYDDILEKWTNEEGGTSIIQAVNSAAASATAAAASAAQAMSGTPEGYAAIVSSVASLQNATNYTPSLLDSSSSADLDVCDETGNVLMRMKDGHIETKNFDSSKIGINTNLTTTAKETLIAAINELDENVDEALGDIVNLEESVANISEDIGNAVTAKNIGAPGTDLAVCDENGYVILQCSDGGVRTKNFDSAKAQTVLLSTGDNTDRAAEINAILATTGECKLGPGNFYVSGIVMSGYSTLSGAGSKTKIILLDSVTNGAAVKMKSYCTVKDVMIGTDDSYTPSSVPTTRYGIIRENDGSSHYIFGKISNVSIEGISQALVLKDITTADRTGLLVENVNIYKCDVGINITKCQYSRFNNIIIASCYSGVLNNAGNNLFMNCTFISCTQAFLMTDATVTNTGHGSVIGCQFNHCGTGNGIAIKANKMVSGFVFSGCQLFASRVEIQNSIGIAFHGCNFGGTNGVNGYQIDVINSDGTNRVLMIDNCIFANDLVLSTTNTSGTTAVIVNNCYKQNGTLITIGN